MVYLQKLFQQSIIVMMMMMMRVMKRMWWQIWRLRMGRKKRKPNGFNKGINSIYFIKLKKTNNIYIYNINNYFLLLYLNLIFVFVWANIILLFFFTFYYFFYFYVFINNYLFNKCIKCMAMHTTFHLLHVYCYFCAITVDISAS